LKRQWKEIGFGKENIDGEKEVLEKKVHIVNSEDIKKVFLSKNSIVLKGFFNDFL